MYSFEERCNITSMDVYNIIYIYITDFGGVNLQSISLRRMTNNACFLLCMG